MCNDAIHLQARLFRTLELRFSLYSLKMFQYMHLNLGVLIKVRSLITFEMPIAILIFY